MNSEPIVYVVDDDPLTLQMLRALLGVAGLKIETFNSGRLFLESFDRERPACLVLDMNMPGMNGLEVQEALIKDGVQLPIIFLTGHGDVGVCAQAFRSGAFDFLQKPADDGVLLGQIRRALDAEFARHQETNVPPNELPSHPDLTPREAEVMDLILRGKTLKQIASELQITIQTAAKHRSRVHDKIGVENDVALVRRMFDPPPSEPA